MPLRVAMLAVRATMSREDALDALNGAGLLSRAMSRKASDLVQMFAKSPRPEPERSPLKCNESFNRNGS